MAELALVADVVSEVEVLARHGVAQREKGERVFNLFPNVENVGEIMMMRYATADEKPGRSPWE